MRTLRLHGILVASAACLLLAVPAGTQTAAPPAGVDIDNFARVNASYFRGSQPDGDDYAALAALGAQDGDQPDRR